ncbi:uncharacterized protein [Primulina eburnea]|uniref:uncharacterized protein isoform X2 n=1 Tax=Primulina eburnea TaxID=1245227 RepID=UPI003C6C242C
MGDMNTDISASSGQASLVNSQLPSGCNSGLMGTNTDTMNHNTTKLNDGKNPTPQVPRGNAGVINKQTRASYASLFKNNRMANAEYKLDYVDTGSDMLEFGLDDIDSIEKTYGICLLGYVISGKPPTAALFDLVRRWGGSYMVFGYHLFLKEMPRCFRFREEDMKSLPSWVQIHGLPPDCWNYAILSKIASKVGKPVHMDMLTHGRKRVKYARVLVELEADKAKINDLKVRLPFGIVDVTLEYELDIKFCETCHRAGHISTTCVRNLNNNNASEGISDDKMVQNGKRRRSASVVWKNGHSRGRSRIGKNYQHAPPRPVSKHQSLPTDLGTSSKGAGTSSNGKLMQQNETIDTSHSNREHGTVHDVETVANDKGKSPMVCHEDANGDDIPSEPDDFKVVSNKKKNKKNNKKKNGANATSQQETAKINAEFFKGMEDSSSCDTEYVNLGDKTSNKRFVGNQEKGRQPEIAFGSQ